MNGEFYKLGQFLNIGSFILLKLIITSIFSKAVIAHQASADKRTDPCSRPLCTYRGIISL